MKKTFKNLLPYIKQKFGYFLLGFLLILLVDAIQLIIPKLIQEVIDSIGLVDFTKADILKSSLMIAGMAVIMFGLRYLWRYFIIGNAYYLARCLRKDYYNHLMKLSQNFFNFSKVGDLMAHATNDLEAVRMLFGMGFVAAADIFLLTIASFIFLVSINLKLTILAILPLPIMSIVIAIFGKKMHYRFTKVQGAFSSLTGIVQESISGIRVVKAFSQEKSELDKMSVFAKDYVFQNVKMAKIMGLFEPFMEFIISFSMGIVLVFGGIATINGDITIGQFIAFFSYLGMLVWPMIAIGWFVNLYQRGTASLKRLNNIFDLKPEIVDVPDKVNSDIDILKGKIEIKNLIFKYGENLPQIFSGITTSINEGETLAIVGRTGCGKSTLLDLLCRVYNPPENSIYFDNNDIYKIPLNTLRNSIVMVPQEIFLFSDTIMENIRFGRKNISDERIIEVTKVAQVYTDIINFDKGFDTLVGERGVTLSGGQKQRIAIARALITDPQILIFDDSLSAVDTKTEKIILSHLIKVRKGKTTIIVAHRISAIEHADKIIVLENGKIIESGVHAELIKAQGFYKELFDKQQIEQRLEER